MNRDEFIQRAYLALIGADGVSMGDAAECVKYAAEWYDKQFPPVIENYDVKNLGPAQKVPVTGLEEHLEDIRAFRIALEGKLRR